MNKFEFLALLRERLEGLPKEDIEKSLDYYSEMIDDSVEDGLTEAAAVSAIGPVDEIVSQILMETSLPKLVKAKVKPQKALRIWEIVLLVLGSPVWIPLLLAAGCIVLSLYIVLWSGIIVLYAGVVSCAAGAAGGVFGAAALAGTSHFFQAVLFLGGGLIFVGITILFSLGVNQIAKGAAILSKQILFGIKACFIRKETVL
ncbi:MAG: DUF1700 domain-containing protein [Eubacteriales bacterium]|nr:DUF1700 domain-containing protein [Eubacteriales bacterium]